MSLITYVNIIQNQMDIRADIKKCDDHIEHALCVCINVFEFYTNKFICNFICTCIACACAKSNKHTFSRYIYRRKYEYFYL